MSELEILESYQNTYLEKIHEGKVIGRDGKVIAAKDKINTLK